MWAGQVAFWGPFQVGPPLGRHRPIMDLGLNLRRQKGRNQGPGTIRRSKEEMMILFYRREGGRGRILNTPSRLSSGSAWKINDHRSRESLFSRQMKALLELKKKILSSFSLQVEFSQMGTEREWSALLLWLHYLVFELRLLFSSENEVFACFFLSISILWKFSVV